MTIDPPPAAPAPGAARTHPLATAGLVLSCAGFAVPIVSGLAGALLATGALQAIAREPDRWGGTSRARTAVGIGLLTGAVPLAVLALVNRDDWGAGPLLVLLVYVGAVAALAASARPGGTSTGRAIGGATLGAGGVLLAGLVLIGLVLAIVFLFRTMISEIAESIGDAACEAS